MAEQRIDASQVRVGDVLRVWWRPYRDTVVGIDPYCGPLKELRDGWIFRFAMLPNDGGMTATPCTTFRRVSPAEGGP